MEKDIFIGDWRVRPVERRLVRVDRPEESATLDSKAFQVLLALADASGDVVTRERLLETVWDGAAVSDEVLTTAIWEIRRALGDDAKNPRYVQTVPRKGYRLIASVAEVAPQRRPRAVVRAALAALVLAMGLSVWTWRAFRAEPLSPDAVAVLPFTVRGSEEFAYLREGLVDLLATTMNTPSQRTVDPTTLLRVVERDGREDIDTRRGREIARHFGAGRYVLGSVVETKGVLHLQANLYRTAEEGRTLARATAKGKPEDLFSLVDELTVQLLVSIVPGPVYDVAASRTTSSLAAFKAFLEGERAVRTPPRPEGYRRAFRHYRRAVELDPAFALAWSRLSNVAAEYYEREPAIEFMEKALEHKERLSERERLKVEGGYHYVNARADDAAAVWTELVRKFPDDAFGWSILANNRSYYDWRRGRYWEESLEEQVRNLERAYALDPHDTEPVDWLAFGYSRLGRRDEAERIHRKLHGDDAPLPVHLAEFRALESGDRAPWTSFLEERARGRTNDIHHAFRWAAAHPQYAAQARDAALLLLDPATRTLVERATGHVLLAMLATSRGRWREAKAELAVAETLYPAAAWEFEAILSLAPFLHVPREDWVQVRHKLSAWDLSTERPAEGIFAIPNEFHAVIRPYLLGLLEARLGETERALRYATELEALEAPAFAPNLNEDFARSVRAHVTLESGHRAEALALLEQAAMDVHPQIWHSLAMKFAWQYHERLLRAELLHAEGRSTEALGWWPVQPARGSSWTGPFAELRASEVFEKQGRTEKAIEHLRRFVEFWRDCDPELRPTVADAELRLAHLLQ